MLHLCRFTRTGFVFVGFGVKVLVYLSEASKTRLRMLQRMAKKGKRCNVIGCTSGRQFSEYRRKNIHLLQHVGNFICKCMKVFCSLDSLRVHWRVVCPKELQLHGVEGKLAQPKLFIASNAEYGFSDKDSIFGFADRVGASESDAYKALNSWVQRYT